MSTEEKNPVENSENKDSLDFQDAKEMTVGEAVRKDSEIKAGVTEEDSVLDRYIKQHRDEVAARKFDTSSDDFQSIDTSTLDNFIKQQRQELVDTGLIDPIEEADEEKETLSEQTTSENAAKEQDLGDTLIAPAINPNQEIWKKDEFDDVPLSDTQETAKLDADREASSMGTSSHNPDDNDIADSDYFDDFDEDDETKPPFYKRKKVIVTSLIVLLLLAGGATYGVYQLNNHSTKTTKTTTSSSTKKTTDFAAASKTFEKSYTAFFADAKRTKLKNNQFANLPKLEKLLKKLKGSKYYDDAKKKYDSLKRQIAAINAVNGKFKTNAIVNGDKKTATVKDDANFDDISEKKLNTGNATLDALLKAVIADGRKQLEANKKADNGSSAASSNSGSGTASNAGNSSQNNQSSAADSNTPASGSSGSDNAASNTSPSTPATPSNGTSNASAPSGASGYGISNYDVAKLQRDRSRVPYDQTKIADSNNSAWTFNTGVLEKIVAISQQRGYITGNDYILEKVNIINGNGYYNMFKPDGTYLFSINCKTGYFVGNAAGHSDKLDY